LDFAQAHEQLVALPRGASRPRPFRFFILLIREDKVVEKKSDPQSPSGNRAVAWKRAKRRMADTLLAGRIDIPP
jgi:hypothetical protein